MGATPPPKLSEEGEKLIQGVQREIEQKKSEERVFLAAYLKPENDKSLIQALPVELAKKIYKILHQILSFH